MKIGSNLNIHHFFGFQRLSWLCHCVDHKPAVTAESTPYASTLVTIVLLESIDGHCYLDEAQSYTSRLNGTSSSYTATQTPKVVSIVRPLDTAQDINDALRSQFERSSKLGLRTKGLNYQPDQSMPFDSRDTVTDTDSSSAGGVSIPTQPPSIPAEAASQNAVMRESAKSPVQVRIEQTVQVRYDPHMYGLEDYRTHRTRSSGWDGA